MKINIKALVQLLDSHESKWRTHITSVIGLVGEDINAAIFVDYLKRWKKVNAEVSSDKVKPKTLKGKRLDRWIIAGNKLYQVEIKNWCSFRIGGYTLPLGATEKVVEELANKNWKRELIEQWGNGGDNRTGKSRHGIKEFGRVSKVLSEMNLSDNLLKYKNRLKPLVIHWMPISNKKTESFFFLSVKSMGLSNYINNRIKFDRVYYFSSSLYLRELIKSGKKTLDLDLPNVKIRLNALNTFLAL